MEEKEQMVDKLATMDNCKEAQQVKTLVILHLKGIADAYLVGVKLSQINSRLFIQYASMCTPTEDNELMVTPAIVPLGMMGDSFGKEAVASVSFSDTILVTEINLVPDSPHKFVQEFVDFWGPEVFE
jgi:hypothetical protein